MIYERGLLNVWIIRTTHTLKRYPGDVLKRIFNISVLQRMQLAVLMMSKT
ncbi:hypothetical protein Asch01_02369 [Acinetobacter schindleri]